MASSLTRPPSPTRDAHPSHINPGHEDDHLASALHAALSTFVPGPSHSDHHYDMNKEKDRAGIEIIVESDCLVLKGTGVDVEPAMLSGHVVLHLTEPTSIKGITLQFRGKARLPAPLNEALSLNTSSCWYSICSHDWSFLEGQKRHSHTLKAGFHHFPFQLQLGGSLPSSIASTVYGGAHVYYKLRAVAIRPGLAHNMQAVMPISIIRSFAPEALEYQQSLEIENTWPEKLMYSIMIPHKAWAIGDKLTAIIKLSPLSKGVRVLTVVTNITETTKLHCRGGVQEHTRSVTTVKHELVNGVTVPLVDHHHGLRVPTLNGPHGTTHTPSQSVPTTPRLSSEDRSHSSGSLAAHGSPDLTLLVPSGGSSSSPHDSRSVAGPSYIRPSPGEPSTSTTITQDDLSGGNDDIVTQLCVTIPRLATPSHTLEPITVSHRVRWSILMSNLDGHTSELRCSLPLHILHPRLLDEARANSAATRRLLVEGPEGPADEVQVVELPSYPAHVRDRVANMYLPDSATTRVMNPWVASGVSPTFASESQGQSGAWTPSGAASPLMPHPVSSHLPHAPQSGAGTPLDWVNSELLLSLSSSGPARPRTNASPHSHSPAHSDPASQPTSRPESRPLSGHVSRAPSPERHLTMSSMSSMTMSPISSPNESSVHDGQASRSLPGLFSMQMKPLTSLTSPGWLPSRSNSHSNLSSLTDLGHNQRSHSYSNVPRTATVPQMPPAGTDATPAPENALWHRAFTEVPDYDVASRGFIGGVTPLTSMRGLPSYEEAERSASGGDGDGVITVRRGGRPLFPL
ncbi:hypothetical protein PAXINDRAFT_103730 [Paxillus involutus ATCC 200175]|uniref:Arrestin C-terminal-like domain-containing protein n=1 Tax=Paxillus involutus ATCC 200175 TaxID=664439 RepID=A0A0C9TEB2_PAXIN|nr:hypothetical protein PAXINDRAFT_103730 [Paxillus involutus ATCC 200175]